MYACDELQLSPFGMILKLLPGPDRKRRPNVYAYRITYRNPLSAQPGCVMTWVASGGRLSYQIALERTRSGELRWHCTCADAIYRGDRHPHHVCKHVQGLIECTPVEMKASA
jgi:hypothetical protein